MTIRTSRTQVSATKPTILQDPTVEYLDLPDTKANRQFLADWAEMKANKSYWEGREEVMKAELNAKTGYKDLNKVKGEKLFVRMAGVLRLKIGWADRTDVDRDLLLTGFPEAFEATKKVITYASVKAT